MFGAGAKRRALMAVVISMVGPGLLASACSSGDEGGAGTSVAPGAISAASPASTAPTTAGPGTVPATVGATSALTSPAAPPSSVGQNADPDSFDPDAFGTATATGANKWFPLTPGYQSVSEGGVNNGSRRVPHRRVYTVTNAFKDIGGVKAVIVLDQDFDGGEIAEQALDYVAEDEQGNVWYLGSYTEAYEGGQFVNANDAWLTGVKGGKAGILMMADPHPGQPEYMQADVPGEGSADAEITKEGESVCVPFNCYSDVLVIREDGSEDTFFAPGVGKIKLLPVSGDPQETENLVNLTQLSPQGLAELTAEALRLDEHARSEARDVFGSSSPAVAER